MKAASFAQGESRLPFSARRGSWDGPRGPFSHSAVETAAIPAVSSHGAGCLVDGWKLPRRVEGTLPLPAPRLAAYTPASLPVTARPQQGSRGSWAAVLPALGAPKGPRHERGPPSVPSRSTAATMSHRLEHGLLPFVATPQHSMPLPTQGSSHMLSQRRAEIELVRLPWCQAMAVNACCKKPLAQLSVHWGPLSLFVASCR